MAQTSTHDEFEDLVRLSFFVEVGKAITSARTLDQTLREVMNQIGNIFAPLNWSLLLRDSKTGDLKFSVVIGKNADKIQGQVLPSGRGIAGWIASYGQAVIVEDVKDDPRFDSSIDEITGFKTQSIIGVPLKSGKRVFGVIELVNKMDGRPFTPFELKVLSTIADFAAIAIEKAYYFKALKKLATVDPLTGVANRRTFERTLEKEVERCRRYGSPLSMLMIDVDGFKNINDKYGHAAGDEVLKALADILTQNLRKADTVCRYGGDEFVILMPNTSEQMAERARTRILKHMDYYNDLETELPFNISIGRYTAGPEDAAEVFHHLDMDLYRQKDKKIEQRIENIEELLEDFLHEDDDNGDMYDGAPVKEVLEHMKEKQDEEKNVQKSKKAAPKK